MKITLERYIELSKIEEPTEMQVISILTGKSETDVKKLSIEEVESISKEIETVYNTKEFVPYFKHKGVLYGFIPNLDKITYGENRDLVSYISNWDTMHRAVAVAYRPIKKNWLGRPMLKKGQYVIEDYKGTSDADKFLDLDVKIVLAMQVFFYNLMRELVNSIPNYFQSKEMQKELISLGLNGEAIKKYIHSLKVI
jgi:hypothetical protein